MFDDSATTSKTLKNIKTALNLSLLRKYGIKDDSVSEKLLAIHGLNKKRFDIVNSIESIIKDTLNDVSIDANSNKNEKTIEGIHQEAFAPIKKAIGFDYLYRQMKELYGKEEAYKLSGEMYDLSIGLSDSTNVLKPYCWSLDASKIVTIGRKFGQLHSNPAKRVSSYISALCETVHQLSSHLAGACAVGSFFLDVSHISLYKEGYDLRELKTNKDMRKKLENEMQQFVHSVNHLSRSGNESPFSNVSIFDRVKLKTIIADMNWYFPFEEIPIEHPEFDSEDAKQNFYINYIIDYIEEVQNIFLDFFDKGDPLKNGAPYRFPIVTLNIGKKKSGDKEVIEDLQFLRNVCKRDIFRYNIFVSEGNKFASCCRLLSSTDMIQYASQSNSFGAGGSLSIGSHRVCTINFPRIALEASSRDNFYEILENRIESAAKILKAHKTLIVKLNEMNLQSFIKMGWINLNRMFSTFGLIGIYEASKMYKAKFGNGEDIEGSMLIALNSLVAKYSEKYGIFGNIEQIPGESFAIRLLNADKAIYGESKLPYNLYSNQFIPLWEEATLWEKLDADGKYNKLITGGGIVHAQIGEKITPKQAEKIIKYAVNSGSEHFALNAIYSECENGHVSFGKFEVCPKCLGKIVEKYTRIVGFFTPVSSWQDIRRDWEFDKRTFVDTTSI
jgi:anaerobic ribonucleoside-triphosphate reductase